MSLAGSGSGVGFGVDCFTTLDLSCCVHLGETDFCLAATTASFEELRAKTETGFLKQSAAAGAVCVDGVVMLVIPKRFVASFEPLCFLPIVEVTFSATAFLSFAWHRSWLEEVFQAVSKLTSPYSSGSSGALMMSSSLSEMVEAGVDGFTTADDFAAKFVDGLISAQVTVFAEEAFEGAILASLLCKFAGDFAAKFEADLTSAEFTFLAEVASFFVGEHPLRNFAATVGEDNFLGDGLDTDSFVSDCFGEESKTAWLSVEPAREDFDEEESDSMLTSESFPAGTGMRPSKAGRAVELFELSLAW